MMARATAFLLVLTSPVLAGEMADICLERDKLGTAACECIETGLLGAISDEDAGLYLRVSSRYFENRDAGQGMSDAWDAAVQAEADELGLGFIELLSRTNEIGTIHRETMQRCK